MTRRKSIVAWVAVLAAAVVLLSGCTPTEFQHWWVSQGHAPLNEPHLSNAARMATAHWEEVARRGRFRYTVGGIDAGLAARMTPTSWRPGCPVPLRDLRYLRATYMGFDGGEHTGELVVHADAVQVTAALLEGMWNERFPIERMRLVDDFGGSDDASIAANNTSAFNCRAATGGSNWSVHAFGRAIDINPVQNPYVTAGTVLPPAGLAYLNRGDVRPGMIVRGDVVWRVVRYVGWGWGGEWSSLKDYQHVSANGR